ncbi:hypothetical protein GQ53DRAFT_595252, partial [Thozetella sp. PMI_491]
AALHISDDPNDVMSMFDSFTGGPMTLDVDDTPLHQSIFSGLSAPPSISGSAALNMPDDTSLLDDDGPNNGATAASTPSAMLGPGAQAGGSMQGPHSTVTEFTKRRNWPAKVVEELRDLLTILDTHGRIKHVSPSFTRLTGYKPDEVLDNFLREFIHPDDVGVFVAELNESIATGNTLRVIYRFRHKDSTYKIFEAVGHGHIAPAKFAPNPNNQSPFCQAVFMMSRAYPTKNAGFLDTILEHRMENERLQRRINELKKEEAAEAEESQRTWALSQEGRSEAAPSEDLTQASATPLHQAPPVEGSMPPPSRPTSLNVALTRENLEGIAGIRADSIREKMARYEGIATHADTIERLTGLRYLEGERSRGITTGSGSPTLIKGDAGIALPAERDPRTGDKKKKPKVAEEYVCTDCGTLDSPEWRKGPKGPKTLCNACGLRWAKKEKKKNANTN